MRKFRHHQNKLGATTFPLTQFLPSQPNTVTRRSIATTALYHNSAQGTALLISQHSTFNLVYNSSTPLRLLTAKFYKQKPPSMNVICRPGIVCRYNTLQLSWAFQQIYPSFTPNIRNNSYVLSPIPSLSLDFNHISAMRYMR